MKIIHKKCCCIFKVYPLRMHKIANYSIKLLIIRYIFIYISMKFLQSSNWYFYESAKQKFLVNFTNREAHQGDFINQL